MKGQFPWIGRSRGSAGGMTTAKINDKNVMRAKAFEVTNPKTAAQVMQRDLFKQVQEVCASVTEDQLRSLFGVKPKTMTRRNALSKQIAAAYSVVDGEKSVDFSKLLAIGNGKKVTTPFVYYDGEDYNNDEIVTAEMLGVDLSKNPNLIAVIFVEDTDEIIIINSNYPLNDEFEFQDVADNHIQGRKSYGYLTCAENGEDVSDMGFGSFIIKTRAEKTGRDIAKE